jgi:hypothetical protein
MAKPTIIIRRGDEIIIKNKKRTCMRKPPSINTFQAAGYRRRRTSTLTEAREQCPNPERSDLTYRQWIERGDLLKIAKINNYVNAETLSLAHLRDVVRSIQVCQNLRVCY